MTLTDFKTYKDNQRKNNKNAMTGYCHSQITNMYNKKHINIHRFTQQ